MAKNKKKNSKKEYNRAKRRILLLILLVLVMILMLFTGTFAWFSSNKHATIESIDINVSTITGLQVSVDAIDWKNEITKDEIVNAYKTYATAENQLPDTLNNVSTVGNVSNGKMEMFLGSTTEEKEGGFTLVTSKQTEINCVGDEECVDKHYIAFDLFFLVTTNATIALTGNSSVVPQEGAQDKGAQYAARVGFVVLGTVGESDSYGAQVLKSGTNSYIWEPNYDRHTGNGIDNAREVYGLETTYSGAARLPYRGVNQEFQTPVFIDQTDTSSYFSPVNPKVATVQGFTANQELLSIPRGISKIRIYMWLEGQDVDLENNIAASKLTYTIEFAMIN